MATTKKRTPKQEFLDKENKTQQEWVTEQLLINMTKTRVADIGRKLREIQKVAYKSFASEMTLQQIIDCFTMAHRLSMSESESNANLQDS